jgi:hypothetical protein
MLVAVPAAVGKTEPALVSCLSQRPANSVVDPPPKPARGRTARRNTLDVPIPEELWRAVEPRLR